MIKSEVILQQAVWDSPMEILLVRSGRKYWSFGRWVLSSLILCKQINIYIYGFNIPT